MTDDLSSYFDSSEFKEVLKNYENMLENGQPAYFDGLDIANIAEYYRLKGEQDKSESAISYGLSLHPGDTDIIIAQASSLLAQGQVAQARVITEAVNDPDNRELYYLKGNIELASGNHELAETYYKMSVEAGDPDNGLLSDIIVQLMDNRAFQIAQKWISKAIMQDPDSRNFLELQADLFFETQDYSLAIDLYNRLLDDFAYDSYYWEQLAQIYFNQEDYAKLSESLDFLEAIEPDNSLARILRVHTLVFEEKYEKAEMILSKLISSEPESGAFCYYYGFCLSMQDKIEDAISYLRKAVVLLQDFDPYQLHQQALVNTANAEGILGNHKNAITLLNKALKTEPENTSLLQSKGHEYYRMGKPETAAKCFIKALKLGYNIYTNDIYDLILQYLSEEKLGQAFEIMTALFSTEENQVEYKELIPQFVACCLIMKRRQLFLKFFDIAFKLDRQALFSTFNIMDPGTDCDSRKAAKAIWDYCHTEGDNWLQEDHPEIKI
ncbi:MAG: tetratricopeptide repeat protein [Bacteroidaceae bacterium]|nr:tetratricopeptide repeat protein [Bacteroidaceae bacterium]